METTDRNVSETSLARDDVMGAPGTERRETGRGGTVTAGVVREEDLEPHEGLRYIARLFKVLSVFLILLLIGEVVIDGVEQQYSTATVVNGSGFKRNQVVRFKGQGGRP